MVNCESPLQHHLLQIAVAQGVAQVPTHAQQDDVRLEMTPFERMLGIHGSGLGGEEQ